MLDDVCHLLLLRIALVRILLQLRDLLVESLKASIVERTVRERAEESGVWVLEWLRGEGSGR